MVPGIPPGISNAPEGTGSGFPSQADDFLQLSLDFNQYLAPHPAATFVMRVKDTAVFPFHRGDLLVIDRSLSPRVGGYVVAAVDGDLMLCRVDPRGLISLHGKRPAGEDVEVWGVITRVLRDVLP